MFNRHGNGGTLPIYGQQYGTSGGSSGSTSQAAQKAFKAAVLTTLITVASAFVFGLVVWLVYGKNSSMEFYTSYLVEQSLSVDNLFVFLLLFDYFKVPMQYQGRCLKWGIIGAVVMRGIMITIGIQAIKRFKVVTLLFAFILIFSAYKLMKENDDDDDNLENNMIMKISKRFIKTSSEYNGDRFFTIDQKTGATVATPLFLCLVCIELSDFIFAVDSIPACLGISHDVVIVFSSNIFAIMSLRSLFIIISEAVKDLPYLKPAVALVLGFVGCKMVGEYLHYDLGTALSLAVVLLLLAGGVLASVLSKLMQRRQRKEHY